MTRRVLVVTHGGRQQAVTAEHEVIDELRRHGLEVVLDEPGADLEDLEIAIVLGGDGTILRAAELTYGTRVPLLGVNLGHVGFLAEAERGEIGPMVRRVAERDYEVEERQTLTVAVHAPDGTVASGWALNEAAVEKGEHARMVEVLIEIDGRPLSSFGCDGIILATPTGSTAHAFSGGGPVVWPDLDAVLVVPLAAHALFARPLVVSPSSVIAIEVLARTSGSVVLTCDGRRQLDVPVASRIEIKAGERPVRLARLTRAPFTDRLVRKFSLPVNGWRGPQDAGGPWD